MSPDFKHSFKTARRAALSVTVYNAGYQKCPPGYGWGPGVRDHFLIHYVVSGRGSLRLENRTFVLEPGHAFLIRPDIPAHYRADEADPWEYYWVGFMGPGASLLLDQTAFTRERPVLSLTRGERFRQSLLDIYNARGSDYPSAVRMGGYLQAALGTLMEEAPAPEAEDALAVHARRGAEFILQNYSRPITVAEVAGRVGVSRSCLYRAFEARYGCSPSDYLIRSRVQRACQLLENTSLPVGAVAASAGFEDHYYFSRAFRRVTGKTPSEYRQEKRLESPEEDS